MKGKSLKILIKERGLKISWVAHKIGVSQPALSMYLNETREMPQHVEKAVLKLICYKPLNA